MGKKYNKTIGIRTTFDILCVVLFIGLTAIGKIQLWFALFAVGMLVSAVAGRFYCGWLCPMHSLMRPIDFLYKKFGRGGRRFQSGSPGRLAPPAFLTGRGARYGFLLLFLGSAVSQKVVGFQAPVLPILTGLALVLVIFFQEQWWHSVLCPFGTILAGSSGKAKFGMMINQDTCTGCGLCEKACPAEAIHPVLEEQNAGREAVRGAGGRDGGGAVRLAGGRAAVRGAASRPVRKIENSRCLSCFACARACPVDAISYGALP